MYNIYFTIGDAIQQWSRLDELTVLQGLQGMSLIGTPVIF
jgi:hypothetical protein